MDSVEGHRYMMESFCKDCNLKLFYMNFIDKYGMLLEDYECTSSNFTDIYLRKSNYSPKQMPYSKLVNIKDWGAVFKEREMKRGYYSLMAVFGGSELPALDIFLN